MEHGLKYITSYVQKHISVLAMCYIPALVRDKPLRAPASVKQVYGDRVVKFYWQKKMRNLPKARSSVKNRIIDSSVNEKKRRDR